MIATDVDGVYVGWGTPEQRRLDAVTPEELEQLELPAGSMGPKVKAACRFARETGHPAVIGSLTDIARPGGGHPRYAGPSGTRLLGDLAAPRTE